MFRVEKMCQVLEVSRSGYYSWRNRRKSKRVEANEKLTEQIKKLHTESRKVYGSPRMTDALRKEGICCGMNRVARIMRVEGFVGVGNPD
jgi:putative transposase